MDDYHELKVIGRGSFGTAVLVRRKRDGEALVIKKIGVSGMSEKDKAVAMNEALVLRKMKHINVISYHDSFLNKAGVLHIVLDYAENGDLAKHITRQQKQGRLFPEDQIITWFAQISSGLHYVHARNVLHRDLKTQNIFLTKDNIVKLGDFGIAKVLHSTSDMAHTVVGTPYYLSPELCEDKPYDKKSDVWALGCVLYEMTTLRHAFDGSNMCALVLKILRGKFPPIAPTYSAALRSLINRMLERRPQNRPALADIIKEPFLQAGIGRVEVAEREDIERLIISGKFQVDVKDSRDDDSASSAGGAAGRRAQGMAGGGTPGPGARAKAIEAAKRRRQMSQQQQQQQHQQQQQPQPGSYAEEGKVMQQAQQKRQHQVREQASRQALKALGRSPQRSTGAGGRKAPSVGSPSLHGTGREQREQRGYSDIHASKFGGGGGSKRGDLRGRGAAAVGGMATGPTAGVGPSHDVGTDQFQPQQQATPPMQAGGAASPPQLATSGIQAGDSTRSLSNTATVRVLRQRQEDLLRRAEGASRMQAAARLRAQQHQQLNISGESTGGGGAGISVAVDASPGRARRASSGEEQEEDGGDGEEVEDGEDPGSDLVERAAALFPNGTDDVLATEEGVAMGTRRGAGAAGDRSGGPGRGGHRGGQHRPPQDSNAIALPGADYAEDLLPGDVLDAHHSTNAGSQWPRDADVQLAGSAGNSQQHHEHHRHQEQRRPPPGHYRVAATQEQSPSNHRGSPVELSDSDNANDGLHSPHVVDPMWPAYSGSGSERAVDGSERAVGGRGVSPGRAPSSQRRQPYARRPGGGPGGGGPGGGGPGGGYVAPPAGRPWGGGDTQLPYISRAQGGLSNGDRDSNNKSNSGTTPLASSGITTTLSRMRSSGESSAASSSSSSSGARAGAGAGAGRARGSPGAAAAGPGMRQDSRRRLGNKSLAYAKQREEEERRRVESQRRAKEYKKVRQAERQSLQQEEAASRRAHQQKLRQAKPRIDISEARREARMQRQARTTAGSSGSGSVGGGGGAGGGTVAASLANDLPVEIMVAVPGQRSSRAATADEIEEAVAASGAAQIITRRARSHTSATVDTERPVVDSPLTGDGRRRRRRRRSPDDWDYEIYVKEGYGPPPDEDEGNDAGEDEGGEDEGGEGGGGGIAADSPAMWAERSGQAADLHRGATAGSSGGQRPVSGGALPGGGDRSPARGGGGLGGGGGQEQFVVHHQPARRPASVGAAGEALGGLADQRGDALDGGSQVPAGIAVDTGISGAGGGGDGALRSSGQDGGGSALSLGGAQGGGSPATRLEAALENAAVLAGEDITADSLRQDLDLMPPGSMSGAPEAWEQAAHRDMAEALEATEAAVKDQGLNVVALVERLRLCDELQKMQTDADPAGDAAAQQTRWPRGEEGELLPGPNVDAPFVESPTVDDGAAAVPMSFRIEALRQSCKDQVGTDAFQRVYEYLRSEADEASDEAIRDNVAQIVGDDDLSLQVLGQVQVMIAYEAIAEENEAR